jgi:hypothetical protein
MQLSNYVQQMWQLALNGETQGVWFWAAMYTLAVCGHSLIFQLRTRSWPFTTGELVVAEVETFGATAPVKSNQDYLSKALYQFTVSGVNYEGTRISPWVFVASHNARAILKKQMSAIYRYPDGKVKVFYNPGKPQKSFLIVAGRVGIFITLLVAVLPFAAFYLKYHL